MSVHLTEAARSRLNAFLDGNGETTVYFTIDNKGCGGNGYVLGVIGSDEIMDGDVQIGLGADRAFVVDHKALAALDGTVVDWEEDATSGNFVFNNPNAASQCGCGQSFSTGPGCA